MKSLPPEKPAPPRAETPSQKIADLRSKLDNAYWYNSVISREKETLEAENVRLANWQDAALRALSAMQDLAALSKPTRAPMRDEDVPF